MNDRDLELLSSDLDNALSPAERAELERRLAADPVLRAERDSLASTRALIASLPALRAPRDFALTPQQARFARPPQPRILSYAASFASAAAAVLLLVIGSSLLTSQTSAPAPAAQIAAAPTAAPTLEQLLRNAPTDAPSVEALDAPAPMAAGGVAEQSAVAGTVQNQTEFSAEAMPNIAAASAEGAPAVAGAVQQADALYAAPTEQAMMTALPTEAPGTPTPVVVASATAVPVPSAEQVARAAQTDRMWMGITVLVIAAVLGLIAVLAALSARQRRS